MVCRIAQGDHNKAELLKVIFGFAGYLLWARSYGNP